MWNDGTQGACGCLFRVGREVSVSSPKVERAGLRRVRGLKKKHAFTGTLRLTLWRVERIHVTRKSASHVRSSRCGHTFNGMGLCRKPHRNAIRLVDGNTSNILLLGPPRSHNTAKMCHKPRGSLLTSYCFSLSCQGLYCLGRTHFNRIRRSCSVQYHTPAISEPLRASAPHHRLAAAHTSRGSNFHPPNCASQHNLRHTLAPRGQRPFCFASGCAATASGTKFTGQ
ncbi:unnamed protein product [Trypanosoma congolense IL3000]|uniref:WGS project CAEQ00000000 data, annotated contig 735 n=1 Tax=Trypanosoma congolense (strain IL3000) TaxID=1068625 RepID=F9WI66_TRYCI|nr:unnamed protein product [Trypanosoma congolense IL3000]